MLQKIRIITNNYECLTNAQVMEKVPKSTEPPTKKLCLEEWPKACWIIEECHQHLTWSWPMVMLEPNKTQWNMTTWQNNIKFHCQCIVSITHGLFFAFSQYRKKEYFYFWAFWALTIKEAGAITYGLFFGFSDNRKKAIIMVWPGSAIGFGHVTY